MRPSFVAMCLVAVVASLSRTARADNLSVHTLEFGTWGAAVASLESDVQGEGRVVHVSVTDAEGRAQACSSYALTLDAVAVRAFRVDRCNDATNSTAFYLIDRAALFEHGDVIPRPLTATLRAVQTRSATASGVATRTGGSDVTCSVAVRPYLLDLERGQRVYLAPGRFRLHALASGVDVRSEGAGFRLRAGTRAGLSIDYEVVDTARADAVVLRDRAMLQCSAAPLDAVALAPIAVGARRRIVPAVTCRDAPELVDGALATGSTGNRAWRPLYRVTLAAPTVLRLRLTSDFGGELELVHGCPDAHAPVAESMVFGGGAEQAFAFDAAAGDYFLAIVDADVHPHAGGFTLESERQVDDLAWLSAQR